MKLKSVVGCCQFKKKDITEVEIYLNWYIQDTWTDRELLEQALSDLYKAFPSNAGYFSHGIVACAELPERFVDIMRNYLIGLN